MRGDQERMRDMCDRWMDRFGRWQGRTEQWQDRTEQWQKRVEQWQKRMKQWQERAGDWQSFLQELREKMTPADQAQFDQLMEQLKSQREALTKARQDLGETLKKLRDLVEKYLEQSPSASATS